MSRVIRLRPDTHRRLIDLALSKGISVQEALDEILSLAPIPHQEAPHVREAPSPR